MAFYDKFPYTNFHELNLDWITQEVSKVRDNRDASDASAASALASEQAAATSADASLASQEAAHHSEENASKSAKEASDTVSNTLNQINLLQSRVDNIIPDGTQTAGNTELLDIRVASDGKIYDSAGNAVRGQVSDLNDKIDKTNDALRIEYTKPNLIYEFVDNKFPSGVVGKQISFTNSDSMAYCTANVEAGKYYSVPYAGSDNFSYWCDKNNNVVLKGMTGARDTNYSGNVYLAPANAAKLYLANAKNRNNNVVIQTTESIVNYLETNHPIGGTPEVISVDIPKLNAPVYYSNLSDKIENIVDLFNPTTKLGTLVNNGDGTVTLTIDTKYHTFIWQFNSSSSRVVFEIAGTATDENIYEIVIQYKDNNNAWHNALNSYLLSTSFDIDTSIDCASLAVYQNAVSFRIMVIRSASDGSGQSVTITKFKIYDGSGIRELKIYDKMFDRMMSKIQQAIDNEQNVNVEANTTIGGVNGGRYSLIMNTHDNVIAVPHIPNKVLYMGNSLLLGIGNQFGMCATSNKKDWAYYVTTAITDKNSNAIITKAHGAAFEQLGTSDSFNTYWNTTVNVYTGEPIKNSFTPDLDLVIIQLGDNVNTADRVEAFTNNIKPFLTNIRNASPNARIIWIDGWFNYSMSHAIIASACHYFALENIKINDLNTTENQGHSGQTYTLNGETYVTPENWLTHPGDTGMELIADRIINVLDM